ncbi:hypothetical protein KFK09_003772 [Dendrobium nobile]|uniref:Uncharacterized protein n=1 Tax=Dendrobium nobile TaxID=94219 RepID=A0A8T3C146_DENNO|nr:hypothetical protein KFK09_003772 [Dendrobium nobile]
MNDGEIGVRNDASVGLEVESQNLGCVAGVSSINCVVEVPVVEIDEQALAKCVSNSSGVEIRKQGDWLIDSSDEELDSDTLESDNEFSLVRAKTIATRGKFWGRGRCKR